MARAIAEIFCRLHVEFGPTDEDVAVAAHLLKNHLKMALPPLYDGPLGPAESFNLPATIGFLARDRHSGMELHGDIIHISFEREKFELTLRPNILSGPTNASLTVTCLYDTENSASALQVLSALAAFRAADVFGPLAKLAVDELAQ
jgi:hypothetical protein